VTEEMLYVPVVGDNGRCDSDGDDDDDDSSAGLCWKSSCSYALMGQFA